MGGRSCEVSASGAVARAPTHPCSTLSTGTSADAHGVTCASPHPATSTRQPRCSKGGGCCARPAGRAAFTDRPRRIRTDTHHRSGDARPGLRRVERRPARPSSHAGRMRGTAWRGPRILARYPCRRTPVIRATSRDIEPTCPPPFHRAARVATARAQSPASLPSDRSRRRSRVDTCRRESLPPCWGRAAICYPVSVFTGSGAVRAADRGEAARRQGHRATRGS